MAKTTIDFLYEQNLAHRLAFEYVTILSNGEPYLHIGGANNSLCEVRIYGFDGSHADITYEDAISYVSLQRPWLSFVHESYDEWLMRDPEVAAYKAELEQERIREEEDAETSLDHYDEQFPKFAPVWAA